MKLIKRQMQLIYKELTELDWQKAYSRYLEAHIFSELTGICSSLSQFQAWANQIWHPIREVETPVETEEEFVQRVTKVESKSRDFNKVQFISNGHGEIVSCVLF